MREKQKEVAQKDQLTYSNEALKKELKHLKEELNESIAKTELMMKKHVEDVDKIKQRY